jgi:hypothetical protein
MPIHVECDCGKSLNVPDKLAGKKGKCPACGAVLNIPAGDTDDEPKVELKAPPSKATGTVGRKCPNCSKNWPADAVICVACGTNLITGERLTTET